MSLRQIVSFGQALRIFRMEAGLSYKDIADQAGVSKSVAKAWERDEAKPEGSERPRLYGILRSLKAFDRLLDSEIFDHIDPIFKGTPGDPPPGTTQDYVFPPRAPSPAPVPELPAAPPAPTTWNDALRAARLAEGLHQRELGELVDVEQSTVSQWETGETAPVLANWTRLVELLPALATGPQPPSRDIPKPVGPDGWRFEGGARAFPRAPTVQPPPVFARARTVPPRELTPPPAPPPPDPDAPGLIGAGRAYAEALVVHGLALAEVETAREALAGAERVLKVAESGLRVAKQDLDAAVAAAVEAAS